MALDIPTSYYTETMVKILLGQGSPGLAMELAKQILSEQPEKASVRVLLEEMQGEAKASFERFRQAGIAKQKETQSEENDKVIPLRPKPKEISDSELIRSEQIKYLREWLRRVQQYRA